MSTNPRPEPTLEAMFPTLSPEQIARIAQHANHRKASAGEIIYEPGTPSQRIFVVIEGLLEVVSPSREGEIPIATLTSGQFTGEVSSLSGRNSLVRARAKTAGEFLELEQSDLKKLIQTDPELSEVFLRAFLLRRSMLIARSLGDVVLIGSSHSAGTLRLKEFLSRNGHPHTYLDVERDPGVEELLGRFGIELHDIPVLMCSGRPALRNPTNAQVAQCLGFNTEIDEGRVHDLIIVGAGPSGLAAAVYSASEGLDVLVLENTAPGGQAGSSSSIENYLGFPTGISGRDLASRAFIQAEKFGAQIAIARQAAGVKCERRPFSIRCEGTAPALGHAILIATGAEYRKLPVPDLEKFEGVGVYYGATPLEGQLCSDEEIIIVGGGNSAGQAAVFLSGIARHVHLLVRAEDLTKSMSRYLIRRIEESPAITFHPRTEVVALEGDGHLENVSWTNRETGETERRGIRHLFSMTGACPNTTWLKGCVMLDDKEFIKTGADLSHEDLEVARWPLRRHPYLFETSIPKIFAVGDVRSGSVKRVASAVGEGSVAVQLIHKVLAE